MSVAGKSVLVTGAATGIGRATAVLMAQQGARVVGIGLDATEPVVPGGEFLEVDIRDDARIRAAVSTMDRIDAVVNAAGVYHTGKRLEELTDDEWNATLDVNLGGIFRVCRATLPVLRNSGGGSIVNVASVHAIATVPGVPAYAASKGGVLALSRQLALDYAQDGIRVNALIVGSVDTRMTRPTVDAAGGPEALGLSYDPRAIPRIAQPREIARVIAFLISDESSFITGSGVTADGGMTALLF